MLYLNHNQYIVSIQDESTSAPPSHTHRRYRLGDEDLPVTSAHSVRYGELHSCLLIAPGGGTRVHSHSALLHDGRCLVAVSSFLVCLRLPDLSLLWHIQADPSTCFGVYHLPQYQSYLSHGELEIARISYDGAMVWSSSGKDIFTNELALHDAYVEVLDFNNERYHIDLSTGQSTIISS